MPSNPGAQDVLAARKAQFRRSRRAARGVKLPRVNDAPTVAKQHTSASSRRPKSLISIAPDPQRQDADLVVSVSDAGPRPSSGKRDRSARTNNASPEETPRTLQQAVFELDLTDLRRLRYDFENVGAVPTVVTKSDVQLQTRLALDSKEHDRIEMAHATVNVLSNAFRAMDNSLKLILDNIKILGDHTLIKPLATATKLALCHARMAVKKVRLGKSAKTKSKITAQQAHALARIAQWRAVELQNILLVFSAEHMIAQTERVIASAPPKLAGVTVLKNALEVRIECFVLTEINRNLN